MSFWVYPNNTYRQMNVATVTDITKTANTFLNICFERGADDANIKGRSNKGIFFLTSSSPYLKSDVYSKPIRCKIKSELIKRAILFLEKSLIFSPKFPSQSQDNSKIISERLIKNLE